MKKGILIIFAIILISGIGIGTYFLLNKDNNKDNNPSNKALEGYVAVFNGGTGEIINRTYVYKIDNGQENSGFKYINVVSRTIGSGSTDSVNKITKMGKVDLTDNVLEVARENNAYSFIMLPGDTNAHEVDKFKEMYVMN